MAKKIKILLTEKQLAELTYYAWEYMSYCDAEGEYIGKVLTSVEKQRLKQKQKQKQLNKSH